MKPQRPFSGSCLYGIETAQHSEASLADSITVDIMKWLWVGRYITTREKEFQDLPETALLRSSQIINAYFFIVKGVFERPQLSVFDS